MGLAPTFSELVTLKRGGLEIFETRTRTPTGTHHEVDTSSDFVQFTGLGCVRAAFSRRLNVPFGSTS
jgi:hypothetical protein